MPPNPQKKPEAVRGRAFTDPATGERRIRIADLTPKKRPDSEAQFTLWEILNGRARVDNPDGTSIRLKPISLMALATITEIQGALQGFALSADTPGNESAEIYRRLVKMATVLMNDDRPAETPEVSEAEVGKLINTENFAPVLKLVMEVTSPLLEGLEAMGMLNPAAPGPPAGERSSTSSLRNSAGLPTSSGA